MGISTYFVNVKFQDTFLTHRVSEIQSRLLITKSDITNSGYNEAQKLIPAKILLYMNRNVSVIANSGYNEISVITNWVFLSPMDDHAACNESATYNESYVLTL